MSTDPKNAANNPRLKRDLSRDAISLALKGDWERAAEVNQALLELFETDVDAMNRLGKAYRWRGKSELLGTQPSRRVVVPGGPCEASSSESF